MLKKRARVAEWKVKKMKTGCQYVNNLPYIVVRGRRCWEVWKSDSECIEGFMEWAATEAAAAAVVVLLAAA